MKRVGGMAMLTSRALNAEAVTIAETACHELVMEIATGARTRQQLAVSMRERRGDLMDPRMGRARVGSARRLGRRHEGREGWQAGSVQQPEGHPHTAP